MEVVPPADRPDRHLDRRILTLAIPALGAIAAEPLYSLADTAVVGHLGRTPLDALAVAATAMSTLSWTVAFLNTATTSAVARARGAGDHAAAGRAAGAAYVLALAVGAVMVLFIELAAPLIARVLGAGPGGLDPAVTYLRLAAIGMPFLFVSFAGAGQMTGLANTVMTLRVAVGANVVNIALEVLLVFGAGLGLRGSALGTVAAQVAAAGAYVMVSWRQGDLSPRRPRPREVQGLLGDGLQLTVRTLALSVAPVGLTAVAARISATALAGNQVAVRIWSAISLLFDALAVPAQVFVSDALGRRDPPAGVRVGRRVLWFGAAAGVGFGLLTVGAAWIVPLLVSPDPAVQHAARIALLVGAACQPAAAAAFVLDGLVLGLGDYAALRRTMLLALIVFVPLAGATLRWPGLGLAWLWMAYGVWLLTRTALLGRRWHTFAGPAAQAESAAGTGTGARPPAGAVPGTADASAVGEAAGEAVGPA